MFKQLAGLLANNAAITLMLTGKADAMTVTVIPKPAKAVEGQQALSTPLVLNGTAEELDEGFAGIVDTFTATRKSLAEQYEATAAVLEAAKKKSAGEAAKGVTKSARAVAKSSAASDPDDGDGDGNDDDDDTPAGAAESDAPTTGASATSDALPNLFD